MTDQTFIEEYGRRFDSLDDWGKDLFNELLVNGYDENKLKDWFNGYIYGTKILNLDRPIINMRLCENDSLKRISGIKNIKNVGAINNEKGYVFSEERGLHLIFGNNGCGKSTLINLLKNISGARGKKKVRCNVFESKEQPSATICYNTSTEKHFDWIDECACPDLAGLQFFDSDYYRIFQNSEAEILLEHNILTTLEQMVKAYGEFEKLCKTQISKLNKNIKIPSEYKESKIYAEFNNIKTVEDAVEVCKNIVWNEELESELQKISSVFSEPDPQTKIEDLESSIESLTKLLECMSPLFDSYSDKSRTNLIKLKTEYVRACELVDKIEDEFGNSAMSETGGSVWKDLWRSAKKYSEQAYPDIPYPNVGEGSRCVLCQQILSEEAKQRFTSFQEYVTSDAENRLSEAHRNLQEGTPSEVADWNTIENILLKGKVSDDIAFRIRIFHLSLLKRFEELKDENNFDKKTLLLPQTFFDSFIKKSVSSLEELKVTCEELLQNNVELNGRKLELSAQKWFHENRSVICNRIMIFRLEGFNTHTGNLSRFKTYMSGILVTQKFVDQFETELKLIGASNIKIELKPETSKGSTVHNIILRNSVDANVPFSEILSEGERRAISFAAFVAELIVNFPNMPLVFDDPTNSMDSDYESKIAERLIRLSKERQVIVFTHRLTMVTYLSEAREGQSIQIIKLKRNPVGANDSDIAFIVDSASNNLKKLTDEAEKLMRDDSEHIDDKKNVLALRVRKLLESVVENVLFDGIVKRNQQGIKPMKLKRMKVINEEDIDFIDGMMSKYSSLHHTQSVETPEVEFSIREIHEDLIEIKNWMGDYNKRKKKIDEAAGPSIHFG